ncbi:hypothetical protein TcWFU_001436 [Taenia crassiceps]|uniref:Uncharacterized protein n=1 Tax=Taenia crassiceps TaxID=6207 RepID=A0ABR4QFQ1_9CEST
MVNRGNETQALSFRGSLVVLAYARMEKCTEKATTTTAQGGRRRDDSFPQATTNAVEVSLDAGEALACMCMLVCPHSALAQPSPPGRQETKFNGTSLNHALDALWQLIAAI